jgi:hypothetical protein
VAEDEPKYVPLKNVALSSTVNEDFLKSLVNRGFIGTGVQQGTPVKLDFRWISVLKKASEMYPMKRLSEEHVVKALGDMMLRMTLNIDCDSENLERGHQLVSNDDLKAHIARYKRDQEFFLQAIEWCSSHRSEIIG